MAVKKRYSMETGNTKTNSLNEPSKRSLMILLFLIAFPFFWICFIEEYSFGWSEFFFGGSMIINYSLAVMLFSLARVAVRDSLHIENKDNLLALIVGGGYDLAVVILLFIAMTME